MATKRDIIIKKFLQYEKDVKEIIDTSIIPSLEDIDVLDLLLYINLYFLLFLHVFVYIFLWIS